jgi:hypothetical protein
MFLVTIVVNFEFTWYVLEAIHPKRMLLLERPARLILSVALPLTR